MSRFLFFFTICLCLISSSLSLISLNTTVCNGTGAGADHDVVEQLISCLVARRGYCRAGRGKNRTYGFSQCGASAVSQDCSACLQQGGDQLLSKCKGHDGGRVYTDKCVVFYQPRPFSSDGGRDPVKGPECGDDAGGGAHQIGKLLDGVLENVTSKNERFAAAVDGAMYAMAQCWGSAGMACGACLREARDALAGICAGSAAGGVAFDGCLLRYQSEPFDFQRRDDQPPPPPTNAISKCSIDYQIFITHLS